jgi:uncharacterized protein (DUF1800 family)
MVSSKEMMRFPARILTLAFAASQTAGAQAPLDHRELPADQQVIHALSRLTFGAKPGDVQKVRAMGVDKWIDLQLHPERIDDSSFRHFLDHYNVLKEDQNDLLMNYAQAQRARRQVKREAGDSAMKPREILANNPELREIALKRRAMMTQLQSSRVAYAVGTNRQLQEVMTDFWLNHFNIYAQKGAPEPYYLAQYERDVIRPNALGKFRDLLEAVAKSPAMLFYLDNARSTVDSTRPRLASLQRNRRQLARRPSQQRATGLNENYGRELLELHTLGVDGGYTQQDVINVARALTGWTIRPPATGGGFVFRPEVHDAGEKVVLGHKLKAGRGIEDGEDVLDIVSRQPATAKFIATKLARRFISDNPPQSVIDRAAQVFMRTDGDIREVVRTIVTSNEFFAQNAYRAKVKSPFEVVVSAMRAMNAAPDSTPRTAGAIAYLGEPLYGHQAPNGYPETGDAWMNTGAILNRINFGIAAAGNRIPGANVAAIPGYDSLTNVPRAKQVDAVVSMLLGGAASPDTRAVLLSGENPLLANAKPEDVTAAMATDDMQAAEDMTARVKGENGKRAQARNPLGRPGAQPPRLTGIAQVIGLALGSPEFQRR